MKTPKIKTTIIEDMLVIKLDSYDDYRGMNFEGYNQKLYSSIHPFFVFTPFNIDSFSHSYKNVLRGFHGDTKTHKLIQVLDGQVQFVVIDTRPNSPSYNREWSMILSGARPVQILVPAGCVNAHLCLSDTCLFSYKLSHPYVEQKDQIHLSWRTFSRWESKRPILSARDEA